MSQLNIAIDGMLLSEPYSGVEQSILNLAHGLDRHGTQNYEIHVPSTFPVNGLGGRSITVRRCTVPTRLRLARIAWEQFALPRILDEGAIDVFHAPGYVTPLRCPAPIVLTIYDVIALQHPEWCKRSNSIHYRLALPSSARRAERIVVPSETTRRDLLKHVALDESRIRVIPLGISDVFLSSRGSERADGPHRLPDRFILFVGQLEPKKNLHRLIDAFQMIKQNGRIPHKLVIAGPAGWRCADLPRRIRAAGLEDDVVMTGYIPDRDLPGLFSRADLFAFPSLYEGFGLPPLEAMACGTPVVASNTGAIPEVLGEAAVLVDPHNSADIAAAMDLVLTNPALHANLTAAGAQRAARFTWRAHAEAVDALYREACRRPV